MASTGQGTGEPDRHRVGEHWSGTNPIPTVHKFIERLDVEKKERDNRIDAEEKARKQRAALKQKEQSKSGATDDATQAEIMTHEAREVAQANVRMVTDPTTGKEIGVEDQGPSSMEAVKDPKVCHVMLQCVSQIPLTDRILQLTVPNANLGKPTVSTNSLHICIGAQC
jgi:hypothetical protein